MTTVGNKTIQLDRGTVASRADPRRVAGLRHRSLSVRDLPEMPAARCEVYQMDPTRFGPPC
jgi:hypothetical protein